MSSTSGLETTGRRRPVLHRMPFLLLAAAFLLMTLEGDLGATSPAPAGPGAGPQPDPGSSPAAVPAGTSPDWWAQAQRRIAEAEYEVAWQERPLVPSLAPSWHAPNRVHGFRTYFTDDGLRIIPRTEDPPSWQWGLRLTRIGRGESLLVVESAVLTPHANRITYDRGSLLEWYVNDPRGLEQGFTLAAPPEEHRDWPSASAGGDGTPPDEGPLAVVFALEGDLSPIVSPDGQAIDFVTPAGARALRYAELHVTDAAGRTLPARMEGWSEGGGRGIRLLIEDGDAAWPISIDPLLTGPAWTAEGNQALAAFGASVATAGDVNGDGYSDIVVGAYNYDNGQTDEGRAFVYHGSASGLSLTPAWTAESDQAGASFGWSAGTAGDVNGDGYADVVVGAIGYDNGQADEGRAFLYLGSPSGLAPTAAWTAESDQADALFGYSVATAGDVNGDGHSDVIVGAVFFDNGQFDEGRAYVYYGSATGLGLTPAWTAESNQGFAEFGVSVATAGDVNGDGYADVVVGADLYDNGQTGEGRAFLFLGSASGLGLAPAWTAESDQGPTLNEGARFGVSVATAGDVNGDGYADVIVGCENYDNGQTDEGRAFLYLGSALGLGTSASWIGESEQVNAKFGGSVGTAGDVNGDGYADVIIGARNYDNGQTDEGRAYVYLGSATGLALAPAWTAESDQQGAFFGTSVATAGDVNGDGYADLILGAFGFDNGEFNEGRAFVYHGSAAGLSLTEGWTAGSNEFNSRFGYSVGTAGDVNGDGYADVIVGAYQFDNTQPAEGRAFVYHGSASGLSLTPAWTAAGGQANAFFGESVGTAGDVNGDGYADVIVGATGYEDTQPAEGRAFVYYGSASGLSLTPAWTAAGGQANASFGVSVGTAGDVNGDGYADVIVGARAYDNGQVDEGRAFVYHGSASGLSPTANWTAESDQAIALFGASVGTAGDVNGDGYSDVIVGAYLFDNGQDDEGHAFVYHGSATGLAPTANWTAESDQASAAFGVSVGSAGDVNGDGYADVIVGAIGFDNGQSNEGRAFVYHGSAAGLAPTANWTAESDQASAVFGVSVGSAGDVNGDGYADVIVGAMSFDNGQTDEGRAFVYHGSAAGLAPTVHWTAGESNENFVRFGVSVGAAGDVNGDGYSDAIVGADGYFDGRAFLYFGNAGPGLSLRPQQRRSDDAAPIAPLGASDSRDSFQLAALGRSPFGRGLVRLEWEVKPLGTPMDGSGIQTSPGWLDTGTAGVALSEVVSGLTGGVVHHWRLRLGYHPAATPFQAYSRWLTPSWNGLQEADLWTPALADLAVTQDGGDPFMFGSRDLVFTVNVANLGPDGVPVLVTDTLPAGAVFVGASPSQGACAPPAAGVLTCTLGRVESGGSASVVLTVTPQAPGTYTNTAVATSGIASIDPTPSDNTSSEATTVLPPSIGDRVWADTNGNGIQDPGEPGVEDVLVTLHDGGGSLLVGTLTDASGTYLFSGLALGGSYRIRIWTPSDYVLAPRDQGTDDLLDSDVNPATQLTPVFALSVDQDRFRWDAGLVPDPGCLPPDEPIYVSMVTLSTDGNNYPILHYQDANQPGQVTGYNVYRSSDPSPPPSSWPLVASDVIDMDEGTPNKQWVDTSGDVPPGGIWYYQVTAFNARCPAEGPF